jgi:hypothetical protein
MSLETVLQRRGTAKHRKTAAPFDSLVPDETARQLLPATQIPGGVTLPRRKLKARKKRKTAVVAIERVGALADNPSAAPDRLVPDATARAELGGVSKMTWWRWQRDPRMAALGFPVAIVLCDRTYRSRAELEAFKARLMQEGIKARSQLQRPGPKPKERT